MQTGWQDIEQLLADGNNIQLKPQGYSMYPIFVPGRDEAIIEPIETGKELKRSDVVLYRRFGTRGEKDILVLHRIWKVSSEGIYLVGDNQKEIEGPLKAEQMKGILAGLIRKGKYISVRNPIYRIMTGGWLFLRPLRPFIAGVAAVIKRSLRRIIRK